MHKDFEDELINMERIKYLCNMSVNRLIGYDKEEIAKHYDEIVSIFCFLDEQIDEKYTKLSDAYYNRKTSQK
ncbi:MAG: hypothetical protein IJQ50_01565 [Clostridia bacterium]|nr:hypothetical protein [Clostridia bacterium]